MSNDKKTKSCCKIKKTCIIYNMSDNILSIKDSIGLIFRIKNSTRRVK